LETIVCVHALRSGTVYGTPGFEQTGTPCPADVSSHHRQTDAVACIKTASGFGGCNAAVVLRKTDGGTKNSSTKAASAENEPAIRHTVSVRIAPDGRPFGEMIRERFKALESPDAKFFKMDDLSRLAYVAAGELLRDTDIKDKYRPDEIGIVLANRSASLDTDIRHCEQMEQNGDDVSPAVFVYTLPNVAAGEVSIRHKLQGEATFFIQNSPDTFVEDYARMLLRRGHLKAVVCGWCELLGEEFEVEMKLLEIIK
jgi:3-oxoacyl-(acyl-carrier-protein) synthase